MFCLVFLIVHCWFYNIDFRDWFQSGPKHRISSSPCNLAKSIEMIMAITGAGVIFIFIPLIYALAKVIIKEKEGVMSVCAIIGIAFLFVINLLVIVIASMFLTGFLSPY